ncbi:hypothetical protein L202_03035 [Cryptococcus amylolentus CBS 6039]|uniref:Amino acid permease/ SLC12A domain-containing protein n=1 Tax=Cryptococcus amylolentus CBS 6039 TaxID=1295533 RepID=A0A1E3HX63_9TREE|nr:hypothetical protein L202_03035 [Cryptococcus amylolentus CBS 6039]ODN80910.1 hypothetical protein L202_03035 [Cryptococcus amylolentus CBS 6039]
MSRSRPPPLLPFSSQETSLSSSSTFAPSAPTPFNTYSSDNAFAEQSFTGPGGEEPVTHDPDLSEEIMYDPHLGIDSHTVPSAATPSSSIRRDNSIASHASSRLLPYRRPGLAVSTSSDIPFSSRPIPAPPIAIIRSGIDAAEHAHDADLSPTSVSTALATPPPAVKFGTDLEEHDSRHGPGGVDIDGVRLEALGYDPVLGRTYTFWSSLAISWLNTGTLQGTIFAVSGTYSYGGPIMILVAWPLAGIFTFALTLTLSELSSAYPVAGAMFSWTWKAARGGIGGERAWAWLVSGFVMGGHVGNILLVTWEIANIVVGTISLSIDFEHNAWYNFLLFLGVLLLVGTVGSTGWGQSHRFWLCGGAFGFTAWLVLCITLLATNATKHNPSDMFKEFYNTTGWSSRAYVYFLGWQFTSIASGADASAHMAEETQNPSRNVPNAMSTSIIATYVLGYISIVLLLLSISPEDAATVKSHSFPFGYILTEAISRPGAISICILMILVLVLQVLAQLQASSRFVFALARENGMPFSSIIRRTNGHRRPVFAVWLLVVVCAPFACMTLASESTLYSVLAVTACTLSYVGYAVPVGLYLFSRIDLQTEGRSLWSLRKWSKPIAVVGLLYSLAVVIVQTLPGSKPVRASTMSWSPVIIVGTISMCYLTWKSYGDKHFAGPIRAITKWESGVEIDLGKTLASSRSKFSDGSRKGGGGDETYDSLKLALSPYHPSAGPGREEGTGGMTGVTVQSAGRSGMTSEGEWTSGSESESASGWTRSAAESRQARSAPR